MEEQQALSGQLKQGYLYAVRLLAITKRSRKELAQKLKAKGYGADMAGQILDRLESQGILSDRLLVQETVQRAVREKKFGRRKIGFELKRKGAAEDMIRSALSRYLPEEERANALELAQLQWTKWRRVEPRKKKKRLYDFLAGRGFEYDLCRDVVSEIEKTSDESD